MKRIFMLSASVLLAGIFSFAQQADSKAQVENVKAPAAQTQRTATIIFYRPGAFYGKALKPSVYVDGEEVGRLKSGKYIAYQTTPGKHMLASSKKDTAVEVTLSNDQPQYVEMMIQTGTWRGAGRLVPVPAEEGKQKADKLKSQED
jgi:hypothetical protein